jgi:hypothetical protein
MGNLLSLDPKIHSLSTYAKILGGLLHGERKFFAGIRNRLLEVRTHHPLPHSQTSPLVVGMLCLIIGVRLPYDSSSRCLSRSPVKPRSVRFQALQICERITLDTAFCCLSARGRCLHTFPARRRGCAGVRSCAANQPTKRLAGHIEAVFGESLPDLFECLSRTEGNLNLWQKKTQEGSLGGGRFLGKSLEDLAVEVCA